MSLREQFPILQRKVNGYPLVYLDNAATTQKPQVVIDAMNAYYSESNANVHRAVHTLAGEATEGYESCRPNSSSGSTPKRRSSPAARQKASTSLLMLGVGPTSSRATPIILTEMEHHSDIVPWQMLAEERGIELRYVPVMQRLHPRHGSVCSRTARCKTGLCGPHLQRAGCSQPARGHHRRLSRCWRQGAHRCGARCAPLHR